MWYLFSFCLFVSFFIFFFKCCTHFFFVWVASIAMLTLLRHYCIRPSENLKSGCECVVCVLSNIDSSEGVDKWQNLDQIIMFSEQLMWWWLEGGSFAANAVSTWAPAFPHSQTCCSKSNRSNQQCQPLEFFILRSLCQTSHTHSMYFAKGDFIAHLKLFICMRIFNLPKSETLGRQLQISGLGFNGIWYCAVHMSSSKSQWGLLYDCMYCLFLYIFASGAT